MTFGPFEIAFAVSSAVGQLLGSGRIYECTIKDSVRPTSFFELLSMCWRRRLQKKSVHVLDRVENFRICSKGKQTRKKSRIPQRKIQRTSIKITHHHFLERRDWRASDVACKSWVLPGTQNGDLICLSSVSTSTCLGQSGRIFLGCVHSHLE